MVRCGYVNPGASNAILHTIAEKIREFNDRRDSDRAERFVATELLIETVAAELHSEIKRVLEVECDIGWVD